MRTSTLVLASIAVLLLLLGGAFVLSLDTKPTMTSVEKVLPDDRFPR